MNKIIIAIMTALALISVNFYMKSEQVGSRMLSSQQTLAQSAFTAWKMKHGKAYGSDSENSYRLQVFTENIKKVNEHNNKPGQTSTVGLNKFADLPQDEFKKIYAKGLLKSNLKSTRNVTILNTEGLPDEVDWRKTGSVTPVKNQGQCGSCWAFSAVGAVESANYFKTGILNSLSEQQLIDCSRSEGNNGCNGGLMDNAFRYVKKSGLETESDYPYTARDGKCTSVAAKTVATVRDIIGVSRSDVGQMYAALGKGPVSVAIEADQFAFQGYTGGVITQGCGSKLDHGVLAVGYGKEKKQDFIIVKNSWGPSWGEKGYVRIAPTQCGILDGAYYVKA